LLNSFLTHEAQVTEQPSHNNTTEPERPENPAQNPAAEAGTRPKGRGSRDLGARYAAQAPDEPEQPLWSGRADWRHFALGFGLYLAAAAAVLIICAFTFSGRTLFYLFILAIIGAVVIGSRVAWIVFSTRYRLTTERLFIARGILHQTIDQIELVRVDDIRLTRSVVDRIFGLGTIQVLSTDFTDESTEIVGIADAENVAELVRSQMRTARRRSLFIENL
jgi:membrane protein YdbS with pleckstrin-like domain